MKTCSQCGWQNADTVMNCEKCGADVSAVIPQAAPAYPPPPPAYPAQPAYAPYPPAGAPAAMPNTGKGKAIAAIIIGVFSGWIALILGIISMVNGSNATNLWAAGQFAMAEQKAKSANTLATVGLVIGVVCLVIGIIAIIAIAVAAANSGFNYSYRYSY